MSLLQQNQNFLIATSSQPDGLDLWYFNYEIFKIKSGLNLKYQRFTQSGCEYSRIKKLDYVP